MRRAALPLLCLSILVVAGCAAAPLSGTGVTVGTVAPEEFLRMRAGPGLGYSVIAGLPEGTALLSRDCQYEVGQRWCRVTLAAVPALEGYVSADYLQGL